MGLHCRSKVICKRVATKGELIYRPHRLLSIERDFVAPILLIRLMNWKRHCCSKMHRSQNFLLCSKLTLIFIFILVRAFFIIAVFFFFGSVICVDIPDKRNWKHKWWTQYRRLLHRPKALEEANIFCEIWEDPQLQLSHGGDEAEEEENIPVNIYRIYKI